MILGILKLGITILSFVGPLFISILVQYLKDAEKERGHMSRGMVIKGFVLVCALFALLLLSSLVNTQYSVRGGAVALQVKGALSLSCFSRALSLTMSERRALDISDSQV